ncbi:MAG: IS481 family transposase [Deltaproteobacteria bacterium]|nr:IS481 family transposase [Deltaproteobacteria bacterium]
MGQVLHGCAATTHAVRAAIQRSQASIAELSRTYGLNLKTVAKWKKRDGVDDAPMGPKEPHSTVLSKEEEALAVAFRRHTLLPLDDCLYALQVTIPHLTRSSLHRCFQRHGISRLPDVEGSKPKKKFKAYPIGYFHIDIAEVWTEEGKLYMFVAIDRTSKFAFAELHERATRRVAADFLRRLIDAVPYKIHTVLTDNGTHFTDPTGDGWRPADIKRMLADGERFRCHSFELACAQNDIDHRLTKPNHPWTNGQVERMNRTIKEATVRRYHYETHDRLHEHLKTFLDAHNFARRLKTLKGLTVFEFISTKWTTEPHRFKLHPDHLIPGPNT